MYKVVKKEEYMKLLSPEAVKIVNTPKRVRRERPLVIYKESHFDKYVLARDNEVPDDSRFNFDILGYTLKEVLEFFESMVRDDKEVEDYFDDEPYFDNVYEGADNL